MSLFSNAIRTLCKQEIGLVLIVRSDLGLGHGKTATQCAHAAVNAYKLAEARTPQILKQWEAVGGPKIVLKVNSLDEMKSLELKAKELKILTSLVVDADMTELEEGKITVLSLGPDVKSKIDEVSRHLKLL